MADGTPRAERFSIWPATYAAAITLLVFPGILTYSFDLGEIIYVVAVLPAVTIALLIFAIALAILKRWLKCLSILLIIPVCLAASWIVFRCGIAIHLEGVWLLHSTTYKAKLMKEPAPANGELRHVDWDGWGMFAQDTNVYLVFDPSDSLAIAARKGRSGKFPGIPCEVPRVQRLESHWYAAVMFTGSGWGDCNP